MDEVYSVLSKCALFENINENEYISLLSCINSYKKSSKVMNIFSLPVMK